MTIFLKDAKFIDWQSFEIRRTNMAVGSGPTGSISLSSSIPGVDELRSGDRIVTVRENMSQNPLAADIITSIRHSPGECQPPEVSQLIFLKSSNMSGGI